MKETRSQKSKYTRKKEDGKRTGWDIRGRQLGIGLGRVQGRGGILVVIS